MFTRIFAPWSLAMCVGAWIIFGLSHALLRIAGSTVLARADSQEVIAVQTLEFGYQVGQPPLFDWLLWVSQLVLPVGIVSVLFVKYALMVLAGTFAYLGAMRAIDDARLALLSSLSLMLLFNVGATLHEQSTHSVALVAAISLTFYAVVGIAKYGRWQDYLTLGVAGAAGILSKHGYPLAFLAFVAALAVSPKLRHRLLNVRFLGTLAIMAVLTAPSFVWLIGRIDELSAVSKLNMQRDLQSNHLVRAVLGEVRLLGSILAYLLPALPVLIVAFPELLRRSVRKLFRPADTPAEVLRHAIMIGVTTAVLLIALLGIENLRTRYVHVLAMLIPTAMLMSLAGRQISERAVTVLLVSVLLFQGGSLIARAAMFVYPGKPFCNSCSPLKPFAAFAADLQRGGFGNSRIFVVDKQLGGNLLVALPNAFVRLDFPKLPNKSVTATGTPCLVAWNGTDLPRELKAHAFKPLNRKSFTYEWSGMLGTPMRTSTWSISRLPLTHRLCK